ncbi:hypothetical protein [endosymbiont GvMRE of Glomus versiforme]|uniref:hypothetical protein n=1 Tax=endosymbiont GvMRE of Glomus versiforme TaxID=2039283 RepID=UPI000EC52D81|nr:hypothetical protein [endosymbiont GvMRE of Glomus versiforme]RHZ35951.1 hypothetical protein GvMRE_Ic4g136 [endosymbiont GvMRE of Glomus versiforme]
MKNTLQNWYNNGNINYYEKQRLNTMGVNDYDYHNLQDLKKMLECEEVAKRRLYIPGKVRQINFFSTWFNNNCAIVISGEYNNYDLRLIIHEPRQGAMPEVLEDRLIITSPSYGEMQTRDSSLERGLRYGENPILEVHDGIIDAFEHAYRCVSLDELPLIKVTNLTTASNPDTQLKPFDIVKRPLQFGVGHHSAIYLGNEKVAHVYAPVASGGVALAFSIGSSSGGSSSGSYSASRYAFDAQGVHIGSWTDFLANTGGTVERYHPIIPYKKEDTIIEHIARGVSSKEYKEGQYSLTGIFQGFKPNEGNCQHFSNRCVLGLNFSEQATKFKKKIPLREEIRDVNENFSNLTIRSYGELGSNRQQVNNAVQSWRNNYQGQQFEAKIEVKPNPPCKIQ